MTTPAPSPVGKLFAGGRVRRLRTSLGLTQSRMADDLGVSLSYLNLIERNQRPITAAVLLRMADVYDVDIRQFTTADSDRRTDDVSKALAAAGMTVGRSELHEFTENHPDIAVALLRLAESSRSAGADAAPPSPLDLVRDHMLERGNHFDSLDRHAEILADSLRLGGQPLDAAVRDRLRQRHNLHVRVLPFDVMPGLLRRHDMHNRQLHLSEVLDGASRTFHLCAELARLEAGAEIAAEVATAAARLAPADPFASNLLAANLANYWAAALMMPYGRFHLAAEQLGYDMEILQARFAAGFEQVAHRLTTLQRPGARGIPFLMLRADRAGQISKRYAAGHLPFASSGGHCPLFILHAAFEQPTRILTQLAETEGGERIFAIARTVRPQIAPHGGEAARFAIVLACSVEHAGALTYAAHINPDGPAERIGPDCAGCRRTDCRQRSQPPRGVAMQLDPALRRAIPYHWE